MVMFATVLIGGCIPPGGFDQRFSSIPNEIVKIDGYPVSVKILLVNDSIYDVEASDGRSVAFAGINAPLVEQDRYRRGADKVLQRHLGDNISFKIIREYAPDSFSKMFIRYEVNHKMEN
jgi:hypothetical protein